MAETLFYIFFLFAVLAVAAAADEGTKAVLRWWQRRRAANRQWMRAALTAALAARPKATPADDALIAVVSATRAYLSPDGIDAQECLNQILAATDNAVIANYLSKLEAGL